MNHKGKSLGILVAKQETMIEALRHRLHLFTQARFGRKKV
jgi:hypothetical protein